MTNFLLFLVFIFNGLLAYKGVVGIGELSVIYVLLMCASELVGIHDELKG